MKIRTLIFLIFSLILPARSFGAASDLLTAKCAAMGGQMIKEWVCPNSGALRNSDFCVLSDSDKNHMVFNGCSGSIGNYDTVFFQACIYHDFCYHHEPVTHGYSKDDCDQRFLEDMLKICRRDHPDDTDCEGTAQWFYRAVYYLGQSAWRCSKELARYPQNQWLQQMLKF